jgi:hypothetical protein
VGVVDSTSELLRSVVVLPRICRVAVCVRRRETLAVDASSD